MRRGVLSGLRLCLEQFDTFCVDYEIMKNASRWILVAPIALLMTYFLGAHPPSFLDGKTWGTCLSVVSGLAIYWALKGVMNALRVTTVATTHEAKTFNEQVKLMATTVNAVALAFLVIALVQPTSYNSAFELNSGLLLLFGLFLHTRTYKILECMKADP